jgi:flagellar basal body-associated protein FliL
LILVSATVTYIVVSLTIPSSMKAPPKTQVHGPVIVAIKDVIVNIADTKGTRMLKLAPHLVVSEQALADIIKGSEAMVCDRIGAVAGKMTIDDLEGANGRSMLKNDIMTRLNEDFKDKMAGAITDVYFEEYLIQ